MKEVFFISEVNHVLKLSSSISFLCTENQVCHKKELVAEFYEWILYKKESNLKGYTGSKIEKPTIM